MTTMPIIDDRMVDLFRRTGKPRSSYRSVQAGSATAPAQRVLLQRSGGCRRVNDFCIGPNGAIGVCDRNLDCVMDFDDDFRLPRFR
jgi:hypothetical protein